MIERKGTRWSWPVSKKQSNLSPEDSMEIREKHQPEQPVLNDDVPAVV